MRVLRMRRRMGRTEAEGGGGWAGAAAWRRGRGRRLDRSHMSRGERKPAPLHTRMHASESMPGPGRRMQGCKCAPPKAAHLHACRCAVSERCANGCKDGGLRHSSFRASSWNGPKPPHSLVRRPDRHLADRRCIPVVGGSTRPTSPAASQARECGPDGGRGCSSHALS